MPTELTNNNNTAVQALRTATDTLTYIFTYTMKDTAGLTSTTQVTVTIAANGDYTYTLNNALLSVQTLCPSDSLTDLFTYTMRDAGTLTSTTQVTVTITGLNVDSDNVDSDQKLSHFCGLAG